MLLIDFDIPKNAVIKKAKTLWASIWGLTGCGGDTMFILKALKNALLTMT